jgi:hypothetical protein
MSKFFNETRSLKSANSAPATANVDIQERVGSPEAKHVCQWWHRSY